MRALALLVVLLSLVAVFHASAVAEGPTSIYVDLSFGDPGSNAAVTYASESTYIHARIIIKQTVWDDPYAPAGQNAALLEHEVGHLLSLVHYSPDSCVMNASIVSPYPTGLCALEKSAATEKAGKMRFYVSSCPSSVVSAMNSAKAFWNAEFTGLFP